MNYSIFKTRFLKNCFEKYILLFLISLIAVGVVVIWSADKKEPLIFRASATTAMVYGAPISINNPAPSAGDSFGQSLSISGDRLLIGAPLNDTGADNAGSVYLYNTTGTLLQTFENPSPTEGDHFGFSVSISGDNVLVGAYSDNTGATDAGSAYLFDATTGELLQTFNNPTPGQTDLFGLSVSMSGDKALIGALLDDTGATDAGSAYLFDATTGELLQTFNNPSPAAYDNFGRSVSISGDKMLISTDSDDTGATNAGSAYLFDTTGTLLYTFNNPTIATEDYFSFSVALSGDKALIGAPNDDTGAVDTGSAYLFSTSGTLLQTFNNPASASGESFGYSVSLSGDKVLVSAHYNNFGDTGAGSAHLFDANTGALLRTFRNPTPAMYDYFSFPVNISDEKIVIGAANDDTGATNAGSAYLYLLQPDTDGDGLADSVDNCPADANAEQTDSDGDGQGNICDFTPNGDTDGDGVDNLADNCPGIANSGQEDNDTDGLGNVCDPTPNGELNTNPTSTDQCKQLGWMDFSFRNQGQCVTFVNTGNDSR